MFPHKSCRINHEITPKIPARCTVEKYNKIFEQHNQVVQSQHMVADSAIKDSELVIDVTRDKTVQSKNESDFRLKERLQAVEFLIEEIGKQKKGAIDEEIEVKNYCKRLINAIKFFRELYKKSEQIEKILSGSADVELTNDKVNRELSAEQKEILKRQDELEKMLIQSIEQSRILRSLIYNLDIELSRKGISFEIDKTNLNLKTNFETISLVNSDNKVATLTTPIEWEEATYGLIRKTSTQTAASKQMRSFIDTVIHEAIESVSFCCQAVNQEFCRRIYETRLAKEALESTQGTTLERLNNVTKSIGEVRAEIVDKEEFIKRCMNRLTNRAQRPGPELCKDRAQIALCDELKSLQQSIEQLQGSIDALETTQRYLLHSREMQADDMAKKIKRLKIDEVDCMSIRNSIEFTTF